ncbi:MAG: phosphotransferase [Acidimicrobiia bacterium]|nr:phosphotransferase [Acidimicrobiia bacterium]
MSADIGRVAGLPKQHEVPEHWRPMHGDFTPWNLRSSGGRLTLVDWEDRGWAPPHADEVLYHATRQALGGRLVVAAPAATEAVYFWIDRVGTRMNAAGDDVDRAFGERVLQALAASSSSASSSFSAAADA